MLDFWRGGEARKHQAQAMNVGPAAERSLGVSPWSESVALAALLGLYVSGPDRLAREKSRRKQS